MIHLVKMRASQINGCAFCIKMHSKDARSCGETEERLYLLDAWREAPIYSGRERAALAWTEALTLVSQTRAPDDDYENLREHFNEAEQVKLTLLSLRSTPGTGFASASARSRSSRVVVMLSSTDRAASFDRERPRLVRIAYRMLGSLAEAEDVVQDAWLRWNNENRRRSEITGLSRAYGYPPMPRLSEVGESPT